MKFLPELSDETEALYPEDRLRNEVLAIKDSVGFKVVGRWINDGIRTMEAALDSTSDQQAILEIVFKRAALTTLVGQFNEFIVKPEEASDSPIEA